MRKRSILCVQFIQATRLHWRCSWCWCAAMHAQYIVLKSTQGPPEVLRDASLSAYAQVVTRPPTTVLSFEQPTYPQCTPMHFMLGQCLCYAVH
jgi:hypothetical protein